MYPQAVSPQSSMASPRSTKDTPLRHIVSSCGSVTYGVAQEEQVPIPYKQHPRCCATGQTHHLGTWRMSHFLWCVCPVHLSPSGSSPQHHQGSTGKGPHPQGKDCYGKWHYSPIGVLSQKHLLFFPRQFYEQVEGAMGSPVSPIVAKHGVLRTKNSKYCPNPPRFWHRYVDDTFVIHEEVNKQGFLQHINSVDPAIKITVEDNKEDGSIPFLDTIVKSEADGTLSIIVYRKPTHTDQ